MDLAERFLIARLSALGDTVCSLPAAVALKRGFPDCHITWVVDPRFAGIVQCCNAVDEVIAFKPTWNRHPRYSAPFDAAFDLQGLLKSGICLLPAKSKTKLGYHWQREGSALFSQRVLPDPSSFHVVDQYVDVVRAAGGIMDRAEFALRPHHEDVLSVRLKLKQNELVGRFVVMNAGAGWATKRWSPEKFAQVIDALQVDGMPTVLIGGPAQADREAADQVRAACKSPVVDLLGQTSVRELVALIRLASAHLGGDTGSTHIAAALDIPAVGLYGITRPQRTCPYGQIERCHYDPLGLAQIEVGPVLDTLRECVSHAPVPLEPQLNG